MRPRARPGGWDGPAPGRPVLTAGEHRDAPRRPDRPWPSFHDMVSRLSTLESAAVFFSLPEATLRALARRLRRIKVSAGDMIVFQGEPGDTIFIIERGAKNLIEPLSFHHCRIRLHRFFMLLFDVRDAFGRRDFF